MEMATKSSICTVIAIFTPKPEFQQQVKELLLSVTPSVHEEAGCEYYTLNEDVEGRLIYIEAWTTKADWLEHMKQPSVATILSGVEGKLVKEVEVYEMYNLPTGASGKGSITAS